MMEELRLKDDAKYHLLREFYTHLRDRKVLAESQDIRLFAQLLGQKEIGGKSRKEMIPRLMRLLIDRPMDRLQIEIKHAENISEQQRQQGFSVLTDKLLRDN